MIENNDIEMIRRSACESINAQPREKRKTIHGHTDSFN